MTRGIKPLYPVVREPRMRGGLISEARLAELARQREAGLAQLAKHLAPLTDRMIDDWAPLIARHRRGAAK